MQTGDPVTSPGRVGFEPTHPLSSGPERSPSDERFDPETTAVIRRMHARVGMMLASRRHDARAPQAKRGNGIQFGH